MMVPISPKSDELAVVNAVTGEILPAVPATLFGTDNPSEVILRAKAHADALADVIKERGLYTVIQKKAYVHAEAWSLLGSQLGVFAVVEGVEPVEVEGVVGFRATVKVVMRDGSEVGRAVAYCMRDEPTWKSRSIHALASMAETRATSRALRKPLGFIVQLAGYQAAGAEEMPPVAGEDHGHQTDVSRPGRSGSASPATGGTVGEAGGGESRPSQHGVGDPGDAPASPTDVPEALQTSEPRITPDQKKKLNVLVGRLREKGLVTTEQLWLEAGWPTPIVDETEGRARFGGKTGLRDRLSKRTAHRLIDWLEDLEQQEADGPADQTAGDPQQIGLSIPAEVKKRMEDRG